MPENALNLPSHSSVPNLSDISCTDITAEDERLLQLTKLIDDPENKDIKTAIKEWSVRHNITHRALKDLLQIMRLQYNDKRLPADPRTILDTPQDIGKSCVEMAGGKYWHFGLQKCLDYWFYDLTEDLSISININIDGLPIHKSSKYQLWPILCNVYDAQLSHRSNLKPMPVGIFFGKQKPSNAQEFLTPFVDEVTHILQNGAVVNGFTINLKIRCFICDSPARAFMKGLFQPHFCTVLPLGLNVTLNSLFYK